MLGGVSRIVVAAAALVSLAVAPVRAEAFGGARGGGFSVKGGVQGFNPGGFQGFNPGGFQGFNPPEPVRPFVPGRFPQHGRFFPGKGGVWGGGWGGGYGYAAPLYYAAPFGDSYSYSYDSPGYPGYAYDYSSAVPYAMTAPAPAYAPPPVPFSTSVGPSAPAPPRPNTIDYAGGRYELRGDGVSTPYIWVWIPDPPAGPPASATAALPPGSPPDDRPPAHRSRLYRWVDEQGVVHLTDNAEAVPEQYRKQTKSNTPL